MLAEASGGEPELILLATGSEVWVALAAREELEQREEIPTRVVSMPCWELFEAQDLDYRDQVLPPRVTARLAVEAGSTALWHRWVGTLGGVVGIDHFGASAPGGTLLANLDSPRTTWSSGPWRCCIGSTSRRPACSATCRPEWPGRRPNAEPAPTALKQGVAVWVDSIARDWLEKGELRRLRDQYSVVGVTSNPTIFQAAIGAGGFYDDQLAALAQQSLPTPAIFERLALYDIRWAAHELHTVYDASGGLDGYVSYEVPPDLAHDTDETVFQATRLFDLLAVPNVMIKIPATVEGLPAIRASIAAGVNVNVTLIFSIDRYREVVEAYLAGLEDRAARAADLRQWPAWPRSSSAGSTP